MAYTFGILLFGMLLGLILEWIVVRFFMPDTTLERESLETSLKARKADNVALQEQVQRLHAALSQQQQLAQAQTAALQSALAAAQQAAQQQHDLAQADAEKTQQVLQDTQQQLARLQVEYQAQAVMLSAMTEDTPAEAVHVAVDGKRVKPVQVEFAAATLPIIEDLTRLNGIGPKLAEAMQAAGIHNYTQLSTMTADDIATRLNGVRYNKNLLESWPKQAAFAAQQDWNGLKQFQASLK